MRSELRELIRSAAAGPTRDPDIADIFRRGRRRAVVARSVSVIGIVAVLAAGIAGASVIRDRGPSAPAGTTDDSKQNIRPPSPRQNETPAPEPCDGIEVCAEIDTPVEQIVVGSDDIWAAGFSVLRLDISTNEIEARQELDGVARALFIDGTRLWVVAETDGVPDPTTSVMALDPTTLDLVAEADPLPGTNNGVVHADVGAGAIWVTGPGAELARVDTDTSAVDRYSYEDILDGSAAAGPPLVGFADGTLWLADVDGTLIAVDPLNGRPNRDATREIGSNISAMGSDGTTLWIAQHGAGRPRLLRYRDGEETGAAELLEGRPFHIAARETAAYVLLEHSDGSSIIEIDAERLDINDPVDTIPGLGFGGLGAGPAGVWSSDSGAGTIFLERP
jgi:hypothetical protein